MYPCTLTRFIRAVMYLSTIVARHVSCDILEMILRPEMICAFAPEMICWKSFALAQPSRHTSRYDVHDIVDATSWPMHFIDLTSTRCTLPILPDALYQSYPMRFTDPMWFTDPTRCVFYRCYPMHFNDPMWVTDPTRCGLPILPFTSTSRDTWHFPIASWTGAACAAASCTSSCEPTAAALC
jgi:hypothetical protein